MHKHIDASIVTVKADAAHRSFNADGRRASSGPSSTRASTGRHPHFAAHQTLDDPAVGDLHRSFPADGDADRRTTPLVDTDGHGTHVAGIIAGAVVPWTRQDRNGRVVGHREPVQRREPRGAAAQPADAGPTPGHADRDGPAREAGQPQGAGRRRRPRQPGEPGDPGAGLRARGQRRERQSMPRIHGVNLSVGYEFDPSGSPAARARCARRSTSWSGPAWWSWSRPATPATAR